MLGFWPSDAVLITTQAALVAVPTPRVPAVVRLPRGAAWASVLPLSLGGTIVLLALSPGSADSYAWVALIGVPVLAVLTLRGWSMADGGSRAWIAACLAVGVLFVVAWRADSLFGQAAAVVLTALSCLILAATLAQLAHVQLLKVGVVVMAALDAVLVFGQLLEGPNDHLNQATPGGGLPQLQLAQFGSALVGYGDLFIAAVLGAILANTATRPRRRLILAGGTLVCSAVFDVLFLAVDVLPATVPIAVVLVGTELVRSRSVWRDAM